jgi:GT2 family glycosyltransferase
MTALNDILVIIVLYKQQLFESSSYKSLLKNVTDTKIDLFVYDNSPQEIEQDIIPLSTEKFTIKYERNISNAGVSLAYNKGAEYAHSLGKKWLLLFDQDTDVSQDFLSVLLQDINLFMQEHIFVPRLFDNNIQLSPCRYYFARGFPYKKEQISGLQSIEKKNLLNSCLCVRLDVFLQLGGYSENVPLYYSDFVFIDKYRRHFKTFVLIDVSIQHKMAGLSINQEQVVRTFELFCIGAKCAGRVQPKYKFYYFVNTLFRTFVLMFRYKKIVFFSVFIRNFL